MPRSLALSLFVSMLWCACASPGVDLSPRPVEAGTATDANVLTPAASRPQGPQPRELTAPTMLGPDLWQDAAFRQRFTESYLAETEIEPPSLSVDEFDVLQEVLDLRAANHPDEAIARLRAEVAPKASATFDLTLAKMLLERENLAEATAAYEAAVGKHPKFRRAWNDLGLIRYRQGQYRSAVEAFSRVIELGGASPTIYGLLGFSHANGEDWLAAESAFRLAAMLDPARLEWRMGLAHSMCKQQRFAESATLFATMIEAQPARGELWQHQAQAFLGMNEPQRAAQNLEVLDRMGQSTAESLYTLGNIYTNAESYELAADAYGKALGKDGRNVLDQGLSAAKALVARGAGPEASRLLDGIDAVHGGKLTDLQKKDVLTLRARCTVAASEEEAKLLEQVVAIDPLDGDALIRLGRFHEQQGRIEQAVFRYERAAGIAAFEADAKLAHGRMLASQAESSEALPLLRRVQAIKPRDNVKQFLEQVERVAQGR